MRIRTVFAVAAAALAVPAAWGQAATPSLKVGVINVQLAVQSTAEGKQAAAELQSQFAPRQTELQNMQKQIQDDEARMRTGATTLSDDEKYRLQREYDTLTRTYQRRSQDAQDDVNQAQQDAINRIGRKMVEVLEKYSKENGYGVVLDTSAQTTPVIWASNTIDVTQQIIQLYDQEYPVKGATAGAAPSKPAPRPATPATPKQ